MCLIKSLELFWWQQLSIKQQFGASAFYTVVHWDRLHEVDNEYTSHNYIVLAICVPKTIKLVEIWWSFNKNKFGHFLAHPVNLLYWYVYLHC